MYLSFVNGRRLLIIFSREILCKEKVFVVFVRAVLGIHEPWPFSTANLEILHILLSLLSYGVFGSQVMIGFFIGKQKREVL